MDWNIFHRFFYSQACIFLDLLLTEVTDGPPVVVVDGEPFAVSRADVDVD